MTRAAAVTAELGNLLDHQIVLRISSYQLGLSCTCLTVPRRGRPGHEFIETRPRFPAAEALAEWEAWHRDRGIEVNARAYPVVG